MRTGLGPDFSIPIFENEAFSTQRFLNRVSLGFERSRETIAAQFEGNCSPGGQRGVGPDFLKSPILHNVPDYLENARFGYAPCSSQVQEDNDHGACCHSSARWSLSWAFVYLLEDLQRLIS